MKKINDDGVDIYKDTDVEIVDMRENRDTQPVCAVKVENGKTYMVCLICNTEYPVEDEQAYMNHKCEQKGDDKLV
jgi:hypothetical protein